ncbi:MAG: DUF1918 domain-containing protein [Candidatus Nanopelagicales bacterium]
MHAKVGDRIVLAGEQVDRPTRIGEVLEVRGAQGAPPYLVKWDDGHTGLLFPGPGSVLRVTGPGEPTGAKHAGIPASPAGSPIHEWTVRIAIFGGDDDTTASAVLLADPPAELRTTGESHRSAHDPVQPRIGYEVAVARALRHLADELLETATTDIKASTGEQEVHVGPF